MTVQAAEGDKKKKGLLSGLLGGGKTIWVVAIAFALLAVFGTLQILGNAAATQIYYVLSRDVPARTLITPDMLVAREAKVDQAPPTAFDQSAVATGEVFTKYALSAGDVITASNAGPLTRITEGVPDTFVAASFAADPGIAVAGKVRTGDFIDIIGTGDAGSKGQTAKMLLRHVLVLDVTVSPSSIPEEANGGQEGQNVDTPGPESEAVRSGIPSVYTVAVSPADATKLALVRSLELFVVLSGNVPDDGLVSEVSASNVFKVEPTDSSAGTFGSIFIKRWDVAFTPGNVYVDESGNVWKVNDSNQWTDGSTILDAGDTPVGYLPIPLGVDFTDAQGTYWVAVPASGEGSLSAVWADPENQVFLDEGDNPDGYDPHAEFGENDDVAATDGEAAPSPN